MKKVVCVSGSVGTGKTTYAKRLARKLKARYIDVNKVIKENNISEDYDKKRKCKIVDIKKLNKILEKIIKESKESLIIDSHMSHFLNPKLVNYVVITKTSLKKLKNRLKKRKYSKSKIDENLEVEIMDICLNEAKELGHKVKIVNN
ncbi:MAG: AAA family ATPase [Nanoarchaeota archaeon]